MTSARTLVLRRGDIETIAQGELDATGIVVPHLSEHHAVAVKHDMVDATIEEIVSCQLDIELHTGTDPLCNLNFITEGIILFVENHLLAVDNIEMALDRVHNTTAHEVIDTFGTATVDGGYDVPYTHFATRSLVNTNGLDIY